MVVRLDAAEGRMKDGADHVQSNERQETSNVLVDILGNHYLRSLIDKDGADPFGEEPHDGQQRDKKATRLQHGNADGGADFSEFFCAHALSGEVAQGLCQRIVERGEESLETGCDRKSGNGGVAERIINRRGQENDHVHRALLKNIGK